MVVQLYKMINRSFKGHIRWYLSFIWGAVLGAVVFVAVYGVKILDVTYDDWILTGWVDITQHYTGWQLYRASGWHFPVGLCDTALYPYLSSVIYTDSIPVASLFFKLLSGVLPDTFQFFGIYGLFCFMMQGGLAKLITRRVLCPEFRCELASLAFVLCAPVLQRLYMHTALVSHYLILMGIVPFLYKNRMEKLWYRGLYWCLLGVLCISTHFYLHGMISVMFLGFVLWEMLEGKNINRWFVTVTDILLYIAAYLLSTVAAFFLWGGFYGGVTTDSSGLGEYSANINALINPMNYSKIIREMPIIEQQYEGFSYVGIMVLLLLIPAVEDVVHNHKELWSNKKNLIISAGITMAVLSVIAFSPVIYINSFKLADIPLPAVVSNVWGIFRSSGRFMWPVMYTVMLILFGFAEKEKRASFTAILLFGAVLQIFEFSDKIAKIHNEYTEIKEKHFDADYLDGYDLGGVKHIQFMHGFTPGEFYEEGINDFVIGYTEYALRHGMTVSNFHFSRLNTDLLDKQIDEAEKLLREGKPDPETIYLFRWQDTEPDYLEREYKGLKYIYLDDDIIAVKE